MPNNLVSSLEQLRRAIRAARAEKELTQEDAANLIGVRLRTFQRWEAGESWPYRRYFKRLHEQLGVPAEVFDTENGLTVADHPISGRFDAIEETLARVEERLPMVTEMEDRIVMLEATLTSHSQFMNREGIEGMRKDINLLQRSVDALAESLARREEALPTDAVERLANVLEAFGAVNR